MNNDPNSIRPTFPVKERPIIFSGEMVRAILEGRKTQTRRVVKKQPHPVNIGMVRAGREEPEPPYGYWGFDDFFPIDSEEVLETCPYGKPGDRLWVRETWLRLDDDHVIDKRYAYRADCDTESDEIRKEYGYKWKPSIHMPRHASRIALEIVSVRVERLQDISEEEAKAEGVEEMECRFCASPEGVENRYCTCGENFRIPFRQLWDNINGKKHPWESNPWVWVIEFKRLTDQ